MRVLYLDCFSGISGDMTVGALCDLGVKPSAFEWELSKLEIGDFHAHWERKTRQNIEGVKFTIHEGATHTHDQDEAEHDHPHHHEEEEHHHHGETAHAHEHEHEHEEDCGGCGHHHHEHEEHAHEAEPAHEHAEGCCGHHHEHGEHADDGAHHHEHDEEAHHHHEHGEDCECAGHAHAHGRGFKEIRELIQQSDLTDFVKHRAVSIFQRIAIAEGKIHGKTPDEVTFHEVGALDSIADIVLACVGIEHLKIDRVVAAPLAEGRGWIDSAHGRFPVPAPATLEILKGIPLDSIDEPLEFITPTGAAIIAEFAEAFGPMPALKIEKVGYGVGSRESKSRPNVLRAVLGELAASPDRFERDTVTRIETNIDDLSPEITGAVTEQLLKAGALDVYLTPVQMKKNRPGLLLSVLCEEEAVGRLAELILRQTTSFGVRMEKVERLKLARQFEKVKTPYGEVTVKIGLLGTERVQVSPEFDSVRAVSEASGAPMKDVYQAALNAAGE